jgi:hypothetical protein
MFEPSTNAVWARPLGLSFGLVDKLVAVSDVLVPPGDDLGASTTPTEASAAAPSMMIDTTMANPTARLRRDRMCAFIPSLGDWNCGDPKRPLR